MHQGNSNQITTTLGQARGAPTVTLATAELPAHTHVITAAQIPSGGVVDRTAAPTPNSYLADTNADGVYLINNPTLNAAAAGSAIGITGGSQPHTNQQPYLVINFCISLTGVYPSQS
jgi:microcystin-dependent protein